MDLEVLKMLGQIAAPVGIAVGAFLFIGRDIVAKNIFPKLTRERAFKLILVLAFMAWTVALAGIGAWAYVETQTVRPKIQTEDPSEPAEEGSVAQALDSQLDSFLLELRCGASSLLDVELERLLRFAEENEGELVKADVTFYTSDCECRDENSEAYDGTLACNLNPNWWAFGKVSHCLESMAMGYMQVGIATFCFPGFDELPLKPGYKREKTATYERIVGKFLVNYEFSLGADHVTLFIPE